jgi:hypothetical protein
VNTNTWASISKGLNKELYIPVEHEIIEDSCIDGACLLDIEYEGTRFKMNQDFTLTKSINPKTSYVLELFSPPK